MKLRPSSRLRILDFDLENRPLSYWYGDNTTAEITAIAASWVGETKVYCWALGEHTPQQMLNEFLVLYDEAGIVTGHNIRRHDLPLLNGALMELGMPGLSGKLTSDTLKDLRKRGPLGASQEALAGMFHLPEPKIHMSQAHWREANRLTPEGILKTKKRVIGDIKQHKRLRTELIKRGLLGAPRPWSP